MIISNSEVDAKLRCERLHYYAYALGLRAKSLSRPNNIGNLGHLVLETYYHMLMEGHSKEDAFQAGMQKIIEAFDHEEYDVVSLISERFLQYTKHYSDDDFRIVAVEGKYTVPLNDHIDFGMTLDLLVEYIKGPWRGQFVVMDHKFHYNFQTVDELSMHVQTYKYIWGLRKLGYPVTRSVLNQIRYREGIKDESKLFTRQQLKPTEAQLETIMEEHLYNAERIYAAKTKPVAWYASHAPRRFNSKDCSGCYFRIPCRQELLGLDVSKTLTSMYSPESHSDFYKPYGY